MKKRVGLTLVLLLAFALSTNPALAGGTVNYTANVQKVVLDNGLTLLLKENPAFDIIALALLSEVGTIYDPQGFEGLTYLTQRNLVSGTENRQALELITELESLGVTLNTLATNDISAVVLQALPDSFAASFEIVLDIIENSVFPEEEFARERDLSLTELMSLTDDPVNALVLAYQEVFYGDHPYRYTAYGSYEGLLAVQREHL
ncbi:M16 family metallopeptidase, partial [Candidatus Darwinibacter acetoxidans]